MFVPIFISVNLISTPLIGRIKRIDEKHVKSKHVVEKSKLKTVIDETKRAPHAYDLISQESLLYSFVVFVRPECNIDILSVRYDTTVSIPAQKSSFYIIKLYFLLIIKITCMSTLTTSEPIMFSKWLQVMRDMLNYRRDHFVLFLVLVVLRTYCFYVVLR